MNVALNPVLRHRPAAVLFDMDGTMLESERILLDAWRQAAAEFDLSVDDAVWLGMIGQSDPVSRAWLHRHLPEAVVGPLITRAHGMFRERTQGGLPVKAGVIDVLQLAADAQVPCAVVTSTWHARAVEKLQAVDLLQWFACVVGGDDVAHPKPAPDPYLLAATQLGVDPTRCVAIEDSVTGVRSALAAGVQTIQIPDLVHPDAEVLALGHTVLASLAQVHALLARSLTLTDPPADIQR